MIVLNNNQSHLISLRIHLAIQSESDNTDEENHKNPVVPVLQAQIMRILVYNHFVDSDKDSCRENFLQVQVQDMFCLYLERRLILVVFVFFLYPIQLFLQKSFGSICTSFQRELSLLRNCLKYSGSSAVNSMY